jgi:DNA-binding CsgD family transcriptional regulator
MDPNATQWLAHIADMLGAEASGMLTISPDGRHSLIANGHSDSAIAQYRDHFSHQDPLPQLLDERPAGRAIVLDTSRHPAYLARPELCNDYLRPHGIDHVIAAQWRHPDGTLHVVGVQRFHGSEPFSVGQGQELDRFIHHWRIGNATPPPEGLTARPTNSRRSCDIASQINIPLAVVNAVLVVAWANTAAHENPGSAWLALFQKPSGGASHSTLRRRLQELVGTSLRHRSATDALIATSDETWFASATPVIGKPNLALLRLTAMHHLPPGIRSRLEQLYGLTRAEAELTVLLAQGKSLEAIALARAVKLDTVRTQLRTVYKKTGTHRQGELVCLAGILGNG